ncbi:hypothetical protein FOA52_002043 [Chlamydomonas sp. UWO 241]|nr:hypothetical protein FOA52_002043 [Chlamydomonas sp. UWO 241]
MLVVLTVTLPLAIIGANTYTRVVAKQAETAGHDVAQSTAYALERSLNQQHPTVIALAALIQLDPTWGAVQRNFNNFASSMNQQFAFFVIALVPAGRVTLAHLGKDTPAEDVALLRAGAWLNPNLLDPNSTDWAMNIASIFQNESIAVLPPRYAANSPDGVYSIRRSIFLHEDEDAPWGLPENDALSSCPDDVCTMPDGRKFWGWVVSSFAWRPILANLAAIDKKGLAWCLEADQRQFNRSLVAHSVAADGTKRTPPKRVRECTYVNVFDSLQWKLCVGPYTTWRPYWASGLMAGVVCLCCVLALLVGAIMCSRCNVLRVLSEQIETNKALETSKEDAEQRGRELEMERDSKGILQNGMVCIL